MAEERIRDAKALMDAGLWEFGYYAAGYAVECALKSCVLARMIYTGYVFQEKLKVNECLTHEFSELIRLAGMSDELNTKLEASANAGGAFVANWQAVTQWKVTSRYEARTEAEARALYAAIIDEPDGVLRWIRIYW